MKEKEIRDKLLNAYNTQIPDMYDEILLKCHKKKGKEVMMEEKKKFNWGLPFAVAFSLLILLSGGLFYNYNLNMKVESIIDIDVNPSIELEVNKKDKIVDYKALNNDAKEILNDMDLKNVDIDTALNAIIGSMVTKGYLDDLSNSILISVDNDDQVKAEEMRQKLVNKIDKILNTDKFEGSVLSQTVSNNKNELTESEALAQKYDISKGKAELILKVLKQNSLLKEEDLVKLNINEINVLLENKNNTTTKVEKQGTASTKAYIGESKAKSIALDHAGVTKTLKMEVEFDADDGMLIYDVEFETSTYEYDKEKNDDVISNNNSNTNNNSNNSSSNSNNNSSSNANSNNTNFISSSKAKEIALNHAGASSVKNLEIELDKEDKEYSVEFIYNNKEYEYEINAVTGKIIEYDIDNID